MDNTIRFYIANASNNFNSDVLNSINSTFHYASKKAKELIGAKEIDVIFFAVGDDYQLGIYGYTPNAYTVQIYIDTTHNNFSEQFLKSTLLHELHHAVRWISPGYGRTLGEEIISEGLATLFEEEVTGVVPPYANVKLKSQQVKNAFKLLLSSDIDHSEWFFGTKNIDNWFGYSYGYQVCKKYSQATGKKASELVHTPADEVLNYKN